MGDINLEIKIKNLEERTSGEINDTINNIYGTSDQWANKTSWAKGEMCISDNKLWKCLVSNSNKPSEGSEWTQISLKSLTAEESVTVTQINTTYSHSINANKIGKEVKVNGSMWINANLPIQWNTIGTISKAPNTNIMFPVIVRDSGGGVVTDGVGLIKPNGELQYYPHYVQPSVVSVVINISYITN